VWPGYRVSVASYTMALLQPRIIQDLELTKYGFEVIKPTPMVHFYGNGKTMIFGDLDAGLSEAIRKLHPDDLQGYIDYREHMTRIGKVVSEMLWEVPPDPGSINLSERLKIIKFALKYRSLGQQ